ncbi:MAG: hypothetical protein DRO23_12680, partial [Thermoprotei archaeon]
LILLRLKISYEVPLALALILVIPTLFFLVFRDRANTFRVALVLPTALPSIPLYITPLFLILSIISNDERLRRIAKWKLIVFTGIDGSGKTSHSKVTEEFLRSIGVDCIAYHWFRHLLVSMVSIIYAKLFKKPIIIHRYTKGKQVYTDSFRKKVRTSAAIFRPLLQLLDNWIFIGSTLLINMLKGRWVICDRYFYDYYIRFRVLGYPVPKIIEWLVYRLTPAPHLLIIFDVNPLISYKRRGGEHPLWYYVYARKEYFRLAKIKKAVVINTEKSFEEVQRTVNRLIIVTLLQPK